jgi:hypothetical protein
MPYKHITRCKLDIMQVEWGIKGLKRKREGLMKRFGSTKPKFNHHFQFVALFTNFPHKKKRHFT